MFIKTSLLLYHLTIFSVKGSINYPVTDESVVAVYPDLSVVEPGTDIEFVCNTTLNISSFHWEIDDETADPSLVTKHDDHFMTIFLNNVGVRHNIHRSTDVVCVNNEDKEQKAGAVVYVGYRPLAPRAECLMQNIDVLHCRWNNTDPRTYDHIEWQRKNHYDVKYLTKDYNPPINGSCGVSEKLSGLYHSSCTAERYDNEWKYWKNMVITFNVQMNKFGKSSTSINFTVMENVMLSRPQLKISQAENNEMGETLEIKADFTEDSDSYFLYCEDNIDLQVEYTAVPKSFDMNRIKVDMEEQFWKDWAGNVSVQDDPNRQYFNNSVLISECAKKIYTSPLPASTNFLLRSKWKLAGIQCLGVWSLYSYMTAETDMLPPPSFSQTAVLFFKNVPGCSSSSCNLFPINSNSDSKTQAILLWKHTEQSEAIHRNNVYHYKVSDLDGSVAATNISKSSRYFPLALTNSADLKFGIKLYAENVKGNTVSPSIMLESDAGEETCHYAIVSVKLDKISVSSLRFEVSWMSSGSPTACGKYDIQDNLRVNLFKWKQMLTEDGGNVLDSTNECRQNGMKMNTLYVEVRNASTLETMTKEPPIEFQTLDVRRSTAEFYSLFQPYAAYRIAIALSIYDGTTSIQGPAHVHINYLYYHNVKKPFGAPAGFQCTGATETSLEISWSPVIPQMRNGPILGYSIYYTTNKSCFAGHGGISRRSPYEFCDKDQVYSKMYRNPGKSPNKIHADGWYVETVGNTNMSTTLTDLQPGTSYYIGISAFNAVGTCNCFRQVIQETIREKTSYTTAILWLGICVVITGCTIIAIIYLRKAMQRCRGEIPGPVFRISMKETSAIQTKYLDASIYNDEIVDNDSCGHLKQTMSNNNDDDMILMNCDEKSSLRSIALYLKPAFTREQICDDGNICDHECYDSSESDVPCGSSSSNGVRSDPSTTYYDSNESSVELNDEIYLSPEIALIKCGKAR